MKHDPEQEKKTRAAFEKYCINQCTYGLKYMDISKVYESMKTRMAWKVWQAAWEASKNDNN